MLLRGLAAGDNLRNVFALFFLSCLIWGKGTSRFAKMKTGGGGGQNREYIYEDGMPNGQRGKKEKGGKTATGLACEM